MMTQDLLKDLVQSAENSLNSKTLTLKKKAIHEIILESQVDGVYYYLVRCQPPSEPDVSLSPREQAIAKLVAQGLPNKCIGKHLGISPWTVATYLRRIFNKLGVTSRTVMIARLLEDNLLLNTDLD